MITTYRITILVIALCCGLTSLAQSKNKFLDEVNALKHEYSNITLSDSLILFTGSSSIRLWGNLQDLFPGKQLLNTGFGGSEMSDLIKHKNALILKYRPNKIFIYEGDNDIFNGKSPNQVLRHHKRMARILHRKLPKSDLFFISTKPSIARWEYKLAYEKFNAMLQEFSLKKEQITYIDVWTPMLNGDGECKKDIFIEDQLHMNEKGYAIWEEIFYGYLE